MKTKQNQSVRKLLTLGVFLLGLGIVLPAFAGDGKEKRVPLALYETVPHVVLPESIQYTPSAKNIDYLASRSLNSSPNAGVASPFVATYTAFPSYQLPYGTPMKTVGQSVYPVSPKQLPQKLPVPDTDDAPETAVSDELTQTEPQALKVDKETTPIQLASNTEEILPATPMAEMPVAITQAGIFCSSQKTPTAWSFNSPLFKAASVPMGNNGFINQMGVCGTGAQVGFNPMMGGSGMPGMMNTSMMGHGQAAPQIYMLPNGMSVMSLPPSHNNCGLLRCRHTGPQWMFLPSGPMGMPMNAPSPPSMPPTADPATLMMMQMQRMQAMQPPQPITAMTPYGMVVVGYRPAPMPMPYGMNPMMGATANPYAMQIQHLQQQIQQLQQQNVLLMQGQSKQTVDGESKDTAMSNDLQVPLPINPQAAMQQQLMQQMPMFGGYIPYAPYAQLYAADASPKLNPGVSTPDATAMGLPVMDPTMMGDQVMMGMNPMMPNPMMFGGNPYMMCGMNGGTSGFNQGGMSMNDVLMLMMLMKDNQPRRQGLFARIAARRAERLATNRNDMFQQLMQAWCTPYMPMDTAMRMPARNAYPYGYFGVQVGPQDTANYGGFYNLYMGNTSYPGLY